ncbi:hypothetical protein KPL71_016162 [Citrus sinensis]|uniref:Uncharacterized protein n=1 Tax=Citrus sinensis TaxID=2711 RepID=A0ACB8KQP3_CITSI|nr:hypothetical protein KPL71_016162 [Citrus sinensis]
MFDFNFDDEIHLIENPHSEAHPSQRNIIPLNLSHENNAEKGSSSGTGSNLPESNSKEKLTASAHANTENLDVSNECAPNVAPAPQMPSIVIAQANHNPTEESSEFQLEAAGEKNQTVGIGDQANASSLENNLPVLGNNAHGSQESSSNLQLLANVAELSPSATSPLNTSLSAAPTMNNENLGSSSNVFRSSNSMEHVELGSSGGRNQSFPFNASSSEKLIGSRKTDSFHLMVQAPHVEMMPQFGRVPAFNSENEINPNSNQLNTPAENCIQNNNLLCAATAQLLPMPILGEYSLRIWHGEQLHGGSTVAPNALYSLLSWPQVNQFLDPNVFDSQFANSMSPASFLPTRPLHSANDPVSENLLNPFSMAPEQSILSRRPHHLPLSANVQETPSRTNTMMPAASMPLSLRPLQCPQLDEQINQAAVTLDLTNLQSPSPLQLKNSLLQRTEQSYDDQGSLTLGQLMPNVIDPPQHDNSLLLRQSSMPSRAQNLDLQGLVNQPIRPIPTYPTPGTSVQLTNQLLNSPTQTDLFGGHNSPGSTPQLELSLLNRNNEQSFLGRRNRATSIYDIGESSSSSSSSKRSKISNHLETGSTSQSRESELDHLFASNPFNLPRPVRNALYDPVFESLGLPIDPHLRLFSANN